ncbi:FHA domain protein [Aeromicrobium marinum DSM 15272]|uniref:FHA domain protein n=1 Tax=Aeromicrobium marinum DSM 15272 TaxID=585531 RepID=E2S8U3_9ACTN|nr:DUF3662 and FHA domain-containing protein [Aeromicrobium marinum]EFQ84598.1 FHA domain protein [Aeromicrobium marinum DSM 15272]
MAGVLQRFEQRLEGAVSGAFARAFRSAVQPVEIAAALQREIDNAAQVLSRQRMLAPNDFTVELSPSDFDRLNPFGDTLSGELATLVREHVKEQRYTLAGGLAISFVESPELGTGRFRVRSRTNATVKSSSGAGLTDSGVLRYEAVLEVNGMRHPLVPPGLVIGRGSEADLRIDDPGISRRHAEFDVHDTGDGLSVTITDLGSTNGVVLNGHRVTTATVQHGAEIRLGNTTLVVRIGEQEA